VLDKKDKLDKNNYKIVRKTKIRQCRWM